MPDIAIDVVLYVCAVTEMITTPSRETVCLGCDTSFHCNVTDPFLAVRWYKNVTLQSKTFRLILNFQSLLILRNVTKKDLGVYVCEVYNSTISLYSSVILTILSGNINSFNLMFEAKQTININLL